MSLAASDRVDTDRTVYDVPTVHTVSTVGTSRAVRTVDRSSRVSTVDAAGTDHTAHTVYTVYTVGTVFDAGTVHEVPERPAPSEAAMEVYPRMTDSPRAVSVALQKGGVGKTTLAINLAERLAARSNDVLLVDLDQQGNATEGVGLADAYTSDVHVGDVLEDGSETTLGDVIRSTDHFDVLPAHEDLDSVENSIRSATFGELWIRNEVVDPVLGETYDYVVVDSPPNLGPLADASLIATQNVIVPLRMSEPSVSGFERMYTQQIDPIRKEIDLDILAIVPNALSGDNEEKRIIGDLEETEFGEYLPQFGRSEHFDDPDSPGPGLRERIAFRRAWREGVPLAEYDPDSDMLERLDELAAAVERGGVADA